MADRRLLVSFAHPDDESFGLGGLISKYVDEGVRVYLICATDGDVGTVSKEMLDGNDSVRTIRLQELDCASKKLGLQQVFRLGFKDSGMMDSESSHDPSCLWYQWQHDPEQVTIQVVDVIRRVRPQVVITFNRYGGYGHPDHIAIQRATVKAFHLAGDATFGGSVVDPFQPTKLYYSAIPNRVLRIGILLARLRRQDPRRLGVNRDIDLVEIANHVEPTHAKVDIRDYLEAWDEASACHESQGGRAGLARYPRWLRRLSGGSQGFTRVFPAPKRDVVDENDLFAGLELGR